MISPKGPEWSVAIFSSREDVQTLSAAVEAALVAGSGRSSVVDVLVNGNERLVLEMQAISAFASTLGRGNVLRFWFIPLGDKSNAWNQYVARVWPGSRSAFFVDGYCRIAVDSLRRMQEGFDKNPDCLATTGIPTVGQSARKLAREMLSAGGIHGNLYALRGETLREIRERSIRLPLGLYRTDPLLGAILCFGLDPGRESWRDERIHVCGDATWEFRPLSPWRISDLKAHLRRRLRQSQGRLENLAIRDCLAVRHLKPELLPETARELVLAWADGHPIECRKLMARDPGCLLALRRLRKWSLDPRMDSTPRLVSAWGNTCSF